MKRFGMLLVFLLPGLPAAQECAQGQTIAFNLSVGAKASWNSNPGAIHQDAAGFSAHAPFMLKTNQGGGLIAYSVGRTGSKLTMSIFSISGARVKTFELTGSKGTVAPHLANGYYLVRLERAAIPLLSTPLVVER
jgi:hypothetical protein